MGGKGRKYKKFKRGRQKGNVSCCGTFGCISCQKSRSLLISSPDGEEDEIGREGGREEEKGGREEKEEERERGRLWRRSRGRGLNWRGGVKVEVEVEGRGGRRIPDWSEEEGKGPRQAGL